MASKLKLLNINSACELLIKNYDGPKLAADSSVREAVATRSKSKEAMVTSVQDSLSNLVTPKTHLKTNVNTLMGFYIGNTATNNILLLLVLIRSSLF